MDIGSTLRNAREHRELTLAHLASRTKIPVVTLHALETNDFARLPRGIFVRGFLRAYAAEVGLDPQQIVAQFLLETGDALAGGGDAASSAAVVREDAIQDRPVDPNLASGPGWGYLLMVATLLAAFLGLNRYGTTLDQSSAPEPATDQALDIAGDSTAAPSDVLAAVATAGREPPAVAGAAAADAATLRFDLQADGECWVEAVVDGRRVVYRLMQPGERQTIESHEEIVLRVGDPGALTYRVNGAPGKPLGRAGIPITVRFTNQGA